MVDLHVTVNGKVWATYLTLSCPGGHVSPFLIDGAAAEILCCFCRHTEGIAARDYIGRI